MKKKLYCYVDENGQDTKGDVFIVSVVVTSNERDELLRLCEDIERESGKRKDKWGRAKHERRMNYLRQILSNKNFKDKLRYSVYRDQINYDMATIVGIAKAVHYKEPKEDYTTIVYVDGLAKTKRQEYGNELRKLGIPTRKVQGVAKDQNNSLIRLADAIAGFIRDIVDGGREEELILLKEAKKSGSLIEI